MQATKETFVAPCTENRSRPQHSRRQTITMRGVLVTKETDFPPYHHDLKQKSF